MSVNVQPTARQITTSDLIGALSGIGAHVAHDPARAIRGQISDLVATYNNPDSIDEAAAINAAREGRAAFWRRTRYHNALVGLVCGNANLTSLAEALDQFCEDRPGRRKSDVLAELVPLNTKAVDEISGAKATAYWEGV